MSVEKWLRGLDLRSIFDVIDEPMNPDHWLILQKSITDNSLNDIAIMYLLDALFGRSHTTLDCDGVWRMRVVRSGS